MAAPASKPYRIAPLRELHVEPVTDPAEQAVLEERLRQADTAPLPDQPRKGSKRAARPGVAELLKQAQHLSAPERSLLAVQLAAQLSTDQRSALVEELIAQLPSEKQAGHATAHKTGTRRVLVDD